MEESRFKQPLEESLVSQNVGGLQQKRGVRKRRAGVSSSPTREYKNGKGSSRCPLHVFERLTQRTKRGWERRTATGQRPNCCRRVRRKKVKGNEMGF